jgi:hypothetical protein
MNRLRLTAVLLCLACAITACTADRGYTAGATPTPRPGSIPVITLPGSVVGTSLALDAANQTALVSVGETGYSGTFAAQSSASGVATVSPASGTSFTVTAIGAGRATVSFTDSYGNVAQLTVTVTITGGVVSLTGDRSWSSSSSSWMTTRIQARRYLAA